MSTFTPKTALRKMYRLLNCDLSGTRKSQEASRYVLIFTETNGRTCHGLMCCTSGVPSVPSSGNVISMYVLFHRSVYFTCQDNWGFKNFFQDKILVTQILYYNGCWPRLYQIKALLLSLVHEHTQLDSTKILRRLLSSGTHSRVLLHYALSYTRRTSS